jgi:hypothetical protein
VQADCIAARRAHFLYEFRAVCGDGLEQLGETSYHSCGSSRAQ